ncbi:hypothetical protein [Haloechinothrix halophila]|uniref:hypothetical protein n=1 Tax=Haloechinothrix halophila TaxID=1069073 RepID=UPI00042A6EDB|nr:hypothetical protein [Haloechinothrix halophila]
MAGEDENRLDYESPNEKALETVAGFVPHVRLAQRLYDKLSAPSGVDSGKFEFSVEEMKQLKKEFEAERDAFERIARKNDQAAVQLQPMANDPASKMHYEAAKDHYEKTFAQAIEDQYSYANAYCYAIEKAILTKEHGEQAAEEMMRDRERGLE